MAHDTQLKNAADVLNRMAPRGERLAYVNPQEERMLKAMGGSGQPAAGGVPSYSLFGLAAAVGLGKQLFGGGGSSININPPAERKYGDETRQSLDDQIALAEDLYKAETSQEFGRPAYARAEQDIVRESLDPDAPQGIGLLELYEKYVAPSIMRQQRQAAQGEIAMLRDLGPEFMAAQRAADPESEALRASLQQRAQEGLDAGQELTKAELAGITEGFRASQAARGDAYQRSSPSAIQETMARLGAGRQAEEQRIARAAGILGQTRQVDPFLALTGRTARVPEQVMGQLGGSGFALQAGPQLYNPESAYAAGLTGQNQANLMNARMASAANRSTLMGGLLQLGGGMFG